VSPNSVQLGLRVNAVQFSLLVGVNALVGAMVGLERSVLPLVGEEEFGLSSKGAILAFVAAFGVTKACANLAAGRLAGSVGRKRLLALGWLLALPVPLLIGLADSWAWIVVANLFLGASQGFAWSMTVLMKIDLAGPARRGLALGLNESAGYLGVAVTAFATGALAASIGPRTLIWVGAAALAAIGLAASLLFVRDTAAHTRREHEIYAGREPDRPVLRTCSQAGFTNNLNDALAWGLAPLYLAANGASVGEIGIVAGIYPGIWGLAQLGTGWLSDHTGRKPLIVAGMLVQAAALGVLVAGSGSFVSALGAAVLLGLGTALVYPTLIAAVSDSVSPLDRARAVGLYRFWRDAGFVAGAILAGVVADAVSDAAAIVTVAGLTAASGVWVAITPWVTRPRRRRVDELLRDARAKIDRLEPEDTAAAIGKGALLIDIRTDAERERAGIVPGSLHVPRSVLEWRADPECDFRNPAVGDLSRHLIVMCNEGFSSSFAAATLKDLGFARVGDLVGGFAAWEGAGLPVRAAPNDPGDTLPGMAPPDE
jgi:MFS family permease